MRPTGEAVIIPPTPFGIRVRGVPTKPAIVIIILQEPIGIHLDAALYQALAADIERVAALCRLTPLLHTVGIALRQHKYIARTSVYDGQRVVDARGIRVELLRAMMGDRPSRDIPSLLRGPSCTFVYLFQSVFHPVRYVARGIALLGYCVWFVFSEIQEVVVCRIRDAV